MFLKKISLNNFRQFYGKQEILISSDKSNNVTLIHAENGVGKTTILNSLLWCFYKKTSARFEQKEVILNIQAASEGKSQVSVDINFEHKGNDYNIFRLIDTRTGEETFKAFFIEKDGNFKNLESASVFIESVVPEEMAKYFFFDGEYAETFSSQGNKSKVKDALEDMLGCQIANTAIKDLKFLAKETENQISVLTKNNIAKLHQAKIDELSAENDKDNEKLQGCENNLKAAESKRDHIIESLRGTEGAKKIQAQRDALVKTMDKLKIERAKLNGQLASWVEEGGLGLIAKKLEETTCRVLEDASVKGKIPSYIAETFVNDIIASNICICGRAFSEHSIEASKIASLLGDAGTSEVYDRLMNARTLIGRLTQMRNGAYSNWSRINSDIQSNSKRIDATESELEECSNKLKGSNVKEIAEKEFYLKNLDQEIKSLTSDIARIRHEIDNRDSEIVLAISKRNKALVGDKEAVVLQKRSSLINKTIERIEGELSLYREEARNKITDEVNKVLKVTARRDYYATIDENFNLDMFYTNSEKSVARSSGENQLLSLAFIAALIKFSSDRINSSSSILKPGTSAPLVLDSPFGQLDPEYQKATAQFLPQMAEQVVLLLSKTQGNAEVMDILGPNIGKQFVLISENTASQGERPSDIIRINGQEIVCSLYNQEKNQTKVIEIQNGDGHYAASL